MRDAAVRFLGERALPRYETMQQYRHVFHRDLWRLIPRVERLARSVVALCDHHENLNSPNRATS